MAMRWDGDAARWIDALDREGSLASMGDGPLLERFLARSGASSEAAFEVLVRRHVPMVLSACRRVLCDGHEVDDAFQATFLVLARRAATIRDPDRLAPWLGRVARRIARRSRDLARRRAAMERRAAVDESAAPEAVDARRDEAALVRAEVDRLPETDRRLIHLTYWQGKTYEEEAALLRWPIGTVCSRLSRARGRLRDRLARLGFVPAVTAAPASRALVLQTVRMATRSAGGMSAAVEAGVVPAPIAAIANGELSAMTRLTWRSAAAAMLLGGAATAGVGAMVLRGEAGVPAPPPAPAPQAKATAEARPMLTNAGVEDGDGDRPRAWASGAAIPGVEYLWSREGHTGKGSLCLNKTAPQYFPIAQWSQAVDHRGKRPRLKVSAWVKAERVTKAILDAQFVGTGGAGDARLGRLLRRPRRRRPAGEPRLETLRGRGGDPAGHSPDCRRRAALRPGQGLVRRLRGGRHRRAQDRPDRPVAGDAAAAAPRSTAPTGGPEISGPIN